MEIENVKDYLEDEGSISNESVIAKSGNIVLSGVFKAFFDGKGLLNDLVNNNILTVDINEDRPRINISLQELPIVDRKSFFEDFKDEFAGDFKDIDFFEPANEIIVIL